MSDRPDPVIDRVAPTRRPDRHPLMYQKWRSLLFLHWEVPAGPLQAVLPPGLELDTFEGRAYVSLLPFTMHGIRPVYLPAVPGLSQSHETNLRTYVHVGGRDPGIWFFSLDANNLPAVVLARTLFRLPYYHARMRLTSGLTLDPNGNPSGSIVYDSERLHAGPTPATHHIEARVPPGTPAPAAVGTLDHFLIERYLLYCIYRDQLYRGQVHHRSYPVQTAEILACEETILAAAGISRPASEPLVHFSGGVDVEIFSPDRVVPS